MAGPPDSPRLIEDGAIDVPIARLPEDVPQPGSKDRLDPSDARLTQAISNRDPTLDVSEAIWTQHAVRGRGGRAKLRWYELDPERLSILRRGSIAKRRNWVFNGAISPTRRGDGAVVHYNVAGPRLLPQIRARARGPGDARRTMEGEITLGRSAAPCATGPTCRWGDYAGASPDPRRPNVVWGSNELLGRALKSGDPEHWLTRNFAIRSDRCEVRDPNLIRGSDPGGETLIGTPEEDEILAGAGPDTLVGRGAADCLYGDGGSDMVRGGEGDDLLDGAGGRDRLEGASGRDLLAGGPRGDHLRGGKGADLLRGQRGADSLRSGRGADRLRGGRGADRLRGGRHDDRLWGGKGNDVLRGGRGRNRIDCGRGRDTVISLKGARDRIAPNCERVVKR